MISSVRRRNLHTRLDVVKPFRPTKWNRNLRVSRIRSRSLFLPKTAICGIKAKGHFVPRPQEFPIRLSPLPLQLRMARVERGQEAEGATELAQHN